MENFRALAKRVSNWGRWGEADQRGTLNFIGPAQVAHATSLAVEGRVFSLGIPFAADGPQDGKIRTNPARLMKQTGPGDSRYPGAFRYADDYVFMALQAATQWDSLAHVHYDGKLFNGHSIDTLTADGAAVLDITNLLPGVVGRGILVDVARHRGVKWLERGTAIHPAEIDAILDSIGVEPREGDILLVRTGWRRKFIEEADPVSFKNGEPGLSVTCVEWLHRHHIAAVGCDNFGVEVLPGEYVDEYMPFHMIAIRDMGMPLAEILDLEALAEDCARDGRYEFLFVGPPLAFPGGVGSPVNPLVIK